MPKTIVHPVTLDMPPQLKLDAGPVFQTDETADESGNTQGNVDWEYPLWAYTIQYRRKSANFRDIQNFFLGRRGRAYGFFWKDPTDNTDEGHGSVKLVEGSYRLVKTYPDKDGYNSFSRLVTRPVSGTVDISAVPGTDKSIDYETGIVTGTDVGEGVATFSFLVPVKFSTDSCRPSYSANVQGKELVDWVNVDMREIRNYVVAD